MNNFENEVKDLIKKYQMDLETGVPPEILASYLNNAYINFRETICKVADAE